jgi:hypothetical protein
LVTIVRSPYRLAHTASIQPETGGSLCHPMPSHRSTPNGPTARTIPDGWRCTSVAPVTVARTTRSRSEPADRSKTASTVGHDPRINQLERPSANRRAAPIGIWSIGRQVMARPVGSGQSAASTVGRTIEPKLGARRSCTAGRSA